ncbi:MAG: anti-sigma factor antagonist [Candidatus Krumholzibacteria bacterium]|nr:anti-sigma factor antagonist [Candidatus Krumholzibacteria bacterium]
MKIVSIDPVTLAMRVACGRDEGWRIPERLASLLMVARDCNVSSITCMLPNDLPRAVREANEQLMARNAILRHGSWIVPDGSRVVPGFYVAGANETFVCARDSQNDHKHSIFIVGSEDNVDRASLCAYLLADVMGFSSTVAFDVRFTVYELLMNVVEHGLEPGSREWIQADLERAEDKLLISVIDRGSAFDPAGDGEFDLQEYVGARKRRGLGLIMMRRMADHLTYRRESGCNKTILRKSISSGGSSPPGRKEKSMAQFEIGGPTPMGDGSYKLILSGDLDAKGALSMEKMLAHLLEEKIFKVTIDFEKVSFISSAGVGILLGLVSSVREAGGDAVFVRITPKVISVLRLLNLEDYFTIRDSVAWGV